MSANHVSEIHYRLLWKAILGSCPCLKAVYEGFTLSLSISTHQCLHNDFDRVAYHLYHPRTRQNIALPEKDAICQFSTGIYECLTTAACIAE